jgi:hypothetical protein
MKCRSCGQTAAINMRHHKLALCRDHYLAWIPEQTERFIEKYDMFTRDDRILVAVSGGKDSLALWDVLTRLGYTADGLYIGLGIDGGIGYSEESHRLAQAFAEAQGLRLVVVDVAEVEGASIPEAARLTHRGRDKPCSVCGLTKRHVMNRVARDGGYDVLATGHNLDDEAATLFGNTLTWSTGYLARQGPVLPAMAGGLARKVKPFFRFYSANGGLRLAGADRVHLRRVPVLRRRDVDRAQRNAQPPGGCSPGSEALLLPFVPGSEA